MIRADALLLFVVGTDTTGEEQSLIGGWDNDNWDEDEGWNSDEEKGAAGEGSWVGDASPTPSKVKPKPKLGAKLGVVKAGKD